MNDFKHYLYLTCLNCKESSDNVGYMNQPFAVDVIREDWSYRLDIIREALSYRMEFSDVPAEPTKQQRLNSYLFRITHEDCYRFILIRSGDKSTNVLLRPRDTSCFHDYCDDPVSHVYVNNPDPYLNVYACSMHRVTPGLWDNTFQHLALGKTSIFTQAVKDRKYFQRSFDQIKDDFVNPNHIREL